MRFTQTVKRFDLKYAIGETMLIIVGVTIALAANSWYESLLDHRREDEYMSRLRTALAMDVSRFTEFEEILEAKATTLKALQTKNVTSLLSMGADNFMRDLDYS